MNSPDGWLIVNLEVFSVETGLAIDDETGTLARDAIGVVTHHLEEFRLAPMWTFTQDLAREARHSSLLPHILTLMQGITSIADAVTVSFAANHVTTREDVRITANWMRVKLIEGFMVLLLGDLAGTITWEHNTRSMNWGDEYVPPMWT